VNFGQHAERSLHASGHRMRISSCYQLQKLDEQACAAQGRGIAATVLLVLHILAYYVADSIIMAEVSVTAHACCAIVFAMYRI